MEIIIVRLRLSTRLFDCFWHLISLQSALYIARSWSMEAISFFEDHKTPSRPSSRPSEASTLAEHSSNTQGLNQGLSSDGESPSRSQSPGGLIRRGWGQG